MGDDRLIKLSLMHLGHLVDLNSESGDSKGMKIRQSIPISKTEKTQSHQNKICYFTLIFRCCSM